MNHTKKTTVALAAVNALLLMLASAPAEAQMRGGAGIPVTPVGTALDKVPVGTWAEYSIKRGDGPPRKLRQALVGKEGAAFVIETRGENGRGERVLSKTVVDADPSKEGAVKSSVVQMGDADPMTIPTGRPPGAPGAGESGGQGGGERRGGMRGARFLKPDPKTLVGKETIKVPAGSFATEHYRAEGPRGGMVDFWLAKDAGPFGLVKLLTERPAGGGGGGVDQGERDGGGPVTVELAARGKGAKPELTKAAKPFDPSLMRGRGDGAGAR